MQCKTALLVTALLTYQLTIHEAKCLGAEAREEEGARMLNNNIVLLSVANSKLVAMHCAMRKARQDAPERQEARQGTPTSLPRLMP